MPLIFSPGRANLIGEHTDYTGGYVLPFALPLGNFFFSENSDKFEVISHLYGKDSFPPHKISRTNSWKDYFRGPILELQEEFEISPVRIEVFGNLPPGAGLSSSASIELGTIFSVIEANSLKISQMKAIELAKKAENEFVGVPCGIMDQYSIAMARPGALILIDCKKLKHEYVQFPRGYSFLIFYAGKRRSLASSSYSEVRSLARKVLEELGKESSPEISLEEARRLEGPLRKVAEYLVRENERVLMARDLLRSEDMESLGKILEEGHEDLSRSLGVGSEDLDLFVEISKRFGAKGARMTGAGFGGSGIAIFEEEKVFDAIYGIKSEFLERGKSVQCWACSPSGGISKV